ncbi:hypothetical protein [Brevibacillus halotolerans]|uniref:hypothetical protein n=1 Tax=Brevibacillus halotolerans TaxID=1507437 RepID=UPI0015EF8218|nr:hypothetical protein [Brevibacillus halotolerans]MBA4535513.1 hypothetical protein [Brevibacillus halotolerans]
MRSKLFSFLMCLALVFCLSVGASVAKEKENPLATPQNYAEYLANYDKAEALRLGVDPAYITEAVQDAKDALEDFKAMSTENQKKLLDYMQSPKMLEQSFTNAKVEKVQKQELISDYAMQPQASTKRVSHEYKMTLLGVDWTIYVVDGKYEYDKKGATKELGASGYVKKNLNPLVQTSKTSEYDEVIGGTYYGTAVFDYKIGPLEGLSYQIGSAYCRVTGDESGKTGGRGWTE